MDKSSSNKARSRTLAPGRLDTFLLNFANAVDFNGLERHFADLLPPALDSPTMWSAILKPTPEQARVWALEAYRRLIQAVWEAEEEERPRALHELQTLLYDALEREGREKIPKTIRKTASGQYERVQPWDPSYGSVTRRVRPTAFQHAINRLTALGQRTKLCANPECPERFYIAQRQSQRYCGEKCAGFFQREAKRNWWQEHGNEWREARREKTKGAKTDGKTKR